MNKNEIIESLKNGLIVSCQAVPGEPHYMPGMSLKMAECAAWAGAVGIRANTPKDVRDIKEHCCLPIIGLWKIDRGIKDVYLTPHFDAARELWEAGAEIIAVQATHHLRDDGKQAYETVREIKENLPDALIFADVATVEDALKAVDYGADFVAPTLRFFFNKHLDPSNGPDFEFLRELVEKVGDKTLIIMEGKVYTPEEAMICLKIGAYAVVVGNAITRPHITAKRFVDHLKQADHK